MGTLPALMCALNTRRRYATLAAQLTLDSSGAINLGGASTWLANGSLGESSTHERDVPSFPSSFVLTLWLQAQRTACELRPFTITRWLMPWSSETFFSAAWACVGHHFNTLTQLALSSNTIACSQLAPYQA
eukprot:scpid89725/ scgid16160/ 